jgi:putative oxidoreductase
LSTIEKLCSKDCECYEDLAEALTRVLVGTWPTRARAKYGARRRCRGATTSQAQYTRGGVTPPVEARAFDADLNLLVRWAGPLGLLARAMLAYIFIVEGAEKIAGYSGVADYMQAHGVDGRLLPLVILAELGGGLLVLFGLKTRWAAITLFGFCLLTALFFHTGADQAIQLQKNVAMAGGFLALALLGPGA